jgi:hypothetical protein
VTLAPAIRVPHLAALVFAGVIAAFAVATEVATDDLSASRKCVGAFSRSFGGDFDRYHCDVTIKKPSTGREITFHLD